MPTAITLPMTVSYIQLSCRITFTRLCLGWQAGYMGCDMKAETNNPYGYKVCYKEDGAKDYTSHFKTYTYRQAVKAKAGYIRFPPRAREDGHILKNPTWVIIPIKHSEVRDGIWHEDPF